MLDKYGQEGELTSLWFSKILIIIEESEKKSVSVALKVNTTFFFSVGRHFLELKQTKFS